MKALLPVAEKIAASLIARKQTIAIAESSTGGLVAATLLAVPGASAYFLGGAVVYTKSARVALLGIGESEMKGLRPATEDYSAIVTAIPPGTPAWLWPARKSARSRCAPAAPTGWRIWMLSRSARSNFLSR
jgi:hypothetical protein